MDPRIDKLASKYTDNALLRAAAQAIPTVGGPLDTLLAWKGSELQRRRIEQLFEELDKAIRALDQATVQYMDFESEEGADLLMAAMRSAARHRSLRRIAALADVVAKRSQGFGNWDEAEDAVRLIDELQDIDLQLLARSSSFRLTNGVFAGTSTFTVGDRVVHRGTHIVYENSEPKVLTEEFPEVNPAQLRLACLRLLGLGFLKDEGINRWDAKSGEYFAFTDSAAWLTQWITSGRLAASL